MELETNTQEKGGSTVKKLQTALVTIFALFLFIPVAQANTLNDIKFFVETYYYGDIPKNLNNMSTVDEIIGSLDEYSRYLTAEEYSAYIGGVAEDNQSSATAKIAKAAPPENQPAVTSSMLYGNIGYIKIETFSADLGQKVETHWLKLKKAGATELIVDLRYNGGGYVDSAEQLLGFYPGVTDAYHLTTREGKTTVKPIPRKTKFPKHSYLLVNRYSASASEIVAAALQDTGVATLVGEKTKGKGSVQSFFELDNGAALKLTIGKFTGPKGTEVHKKGITPTIKTISGNELTTIHERLLNQSFTKKHYRNTGELTKVPTDKTFHIQFTQPMNFRDMQTSHTIELVKLGGVAVPVQFKESSANTLDVIPNKKLQSGGNYILVVNPGAKSNKGRTVKQGTFTKVSVSGAK